MRPCVGSFMQLASSIEYVSGAEHLRCAAMAVVFAALSALLWGGGDFLGGSAAQKSSPIPATLVSSAVGFVVVLVGAIFVIQGSPTGHDLVLGAVSGVFVGCALLAFYASMAMGKMSIDAPISALASAGVPLIVGLVEGDPLSVLGWAAVIAGLVGIGFASREESVDADDGPDVAIAATRQEPADANDGGTTPESRRASLSIVLALLAGVGFGSYLAIIAQTSEGAGLWPLLASRAGSLVSLVMVALITKQFVAPTPAIRESAAAGVFDGLGNTMYLMATRHGDLAVVGTIGSMYPASTVALAAIVHHERPHRVQAIGIVLLLACVVILGSPWA